jgi:hypothetical protein
VDFPDMPPLIAWRRRLVYQQLPLYLEARWHPETGTREEVRWHLKTGTTEDPCRIEHCPPAVLKFLWRGMQLLRRLTSTGRPVGAVGKDTLTTEEFLQKARQAIQLLRQRGEKVTQEKVAQEMHLSCDVQLRRYLTKFHVSWDDLKSEQ